MNQQFIQHLTEITKNNAKLMKTEIYVAMNHLKKFFSKRYIAAMCIESTNHKEQQLLY